MTDEEIRALLVPGSLVWLWVDFGDIRTNGGSAERHVEFKIDEVSQSEPFASGTATSKGEKFGRCTVCLVPPVPGGGLPRTRGRHLIGAGRTAIGTFVVGEVGDRPGLIFPFTGESALVSIKRPQYRAMPSKPARVNT